MGTAYAAAATTSASANAAPLGPMPFSRSAEMGPTAFVDAFATRHATSTAGYSARFGACARLDAISAATPASGGSAKIIERAARAVDAMRCT